MWPRAWESGRPAQHALGRLERSRAPLLGGLAGLIAWLVLRRRDPERRWRSAFAMGVLSGLFSTAVVSLGAARIGRSAKEDWMVVGTVLRGADSVRTRPQAPEVLAGVGVHQSAELGWGLLLFGSAGSWLRRLRVRAMLALALPWAILTSAVEYFVLLPWLQPLLTRQIPYWSGLVVHVLSGSTYPLYSWLQARISGSRRPVPAAVKRHGLVLAVILGAFGLLYLRARRRGEPALRGGAGAGERAFLAATVRHHQVGIQMARLAAQRAVSPELRQLARLMIAEQNADVAIMQRWWQSWYGAPLPSLDGEWEKIPGMPHPRAVVQLRNLHGFAFERQFLALMIPHHEGMLVLIERARPLGTARLRILAASIAHGHVGQLGRLRAQPAAPRITVPAERLFVATTPSDLQGVGG